MKAFLKTVFWIPLAVGLIAGISIGIMCFTGVVRQIFNPRVLTIHQD